MRNILTTGGDECIVELILRSHGVSLSSSQVRVANLDCTRDQCVLSLAAVESADALYHGTAEYVYQKASLAERLPTDLTYGGQYPATVERFLETLTSSFGIYFEAADLSLVTPGGLIPLSSIEYLGRVPGLNGQLLFETNDASKRWIGGHRFPIYITDRNIVEWSPLSLTGNAPDSPGVGSYSYAYTVSGGYPPYRFEVTTGHPPAALNETTGRLEGPLLRAGALRWSVRVTDSRNQTADIFDTANVAITELAFVTPAQLPPTQAGAETVTAIEAGGGALGHRYSIPTPALGFHITEDGQLHYQLDAGTHSVTVRATDAANYYVDRVFTIQVASRNTREIAQSITGKLLLWSDFTEGVFNEGVVLEPVYVRPGFSNTFTVVGQAEASTAFSDGSVQLQGGYLYGEQRLLYDFAIMLFYDQDTMALGSGLAGRSDGVAGWELYSDDATPNTLLFNCVIAGQGRSLAATLPPQTPARRMVVAQRGGSYMGVHLNSERLAYRSVPTSAMESPASAPFLIGARSRFPTTSSWRADLDRVVIFRERLWSDEIAYLYNAGQGRSYLDLTADAE